MKTISKEVIVKVVIVLPLVWCFSGLYAFSNGDKILNVLVPIALIARLAFLGTQDILPILRQNKWLWIILANLIFAVIAHFTYGVSSYKLRVFALMSIYLTVFPVQYLKHFSLRSLSWLLSLSLILFMVLQFIDGNLLNRKWSINPIRVGLVSAFLVLLSLYFILIDNNVKERFISFLCAISAFIPLILSVSRGPWLALGFGLVVLFIFAFKKEMLNTKAVVGLSFALLAISFFLKDPIIKRIEVTQKEFARIQSNDMGSSIGLRLQMWSAGLEIIQEHWVLGIGNEGVIDAKEAMIKEGRYTRKAADFVHFHNQWINDLAKYGVIGLILTLCLAFYPVLKTKNKDARPILIILLGTYLVLSMTDMPFERSHPLFFYLMCTYLLLHREFKINEKITP